jgi:uncharacterized protein (TIGR02271 family)
MDSVGTAGGGRVTLSFPKDQLPDYQMGGPDERATDTGRLSDYRAATTRVETAPRMQGGVTDHTGTSESPIHDGETDEQRTLRLREERLRVEKETVQAGEVGLRKEVVSEEQTINVPVRREEVYIERRPVNEQVTGEEIDEGEEIRVPVREERVTVHKDTVVTGEVAVGKRAVQETRRVTDTVRREEARLETEGDVRPIHEAADATHDVAENHEHAGAPMPRHAP